MPFKKDYLNEPLQGNQWKESDDKKEYDPHVFMYCFVAGVTVALIALVVVIIVLLRDRRKRHRHECACHLRSGRDIGNEYALDNSAFTGSIIHPPEYSGRGVPHSGQGNHPACMVSGTGLPGQRSPFPQTFPSQSECRETLPDANCDNIINDFHQNNITTSDTRLPVLNPIFAGENTEMITVQSDNESLKNLYKITERSLTQTVCGKLVVSVARYVEYSGDILYLDNMGISLHVPEGAVKRGSKVLISLVLNWDLSDNPKMNNEQSLVSPVVYVGPHGLKLLKPCILSFRHCSFDPRQIRVMRSETELSSQKTWEEVCEGTDTTGYCYLTPNECQLQIDTFTLYTCIQAPLDNRIGKKWLQIAAFATPLRKDLNHHQIRLYFLNKTPCALQWAIQNEASFGGKLVCPEKAFLFDGGNDLDMFTKTKYLSDGWLPIDDANIDKISFLNIWHGHCPHIAVCFKRTTSTHVATDRKRKCAIEMTLHLLTYQNMREEDSEKIVVQVFEDNMTPLSDKEHVCNRHHVGDLEIHVNNNFPQLSTFTNHRSSNDSSSYPTSGYGSLIARGNNSRTHVKSVPEICSTNNDNGASNSDLGESLESTSERDNKIKVFINNTPDYPRESPSDLVSCDKREVPHELRRELKLLLDPKKDLGSDWRDLAAELGLDKCIPMLETKDCPTEEILRYCEHYNIDLIELQHKFQAINRLDCACVIEKYLQKKKTVKSKYPVENSHSAFQFYKGGRLKSGRMREGGATPVENDDTDLVELRQGNNRVYRYSGHIAPRAQYNNK